MMKDFDLGSLEMSGTPGFDSMLRREAHIVKPHSTGRTKVASVAALKPFMRLSSETLVHKSDRDLWALRKEADGSYFIERLFDDNGDPIKG
jgi:hypothetical protein